MTWTLVAPILAAATLPGSTIMVQTSETDTRTATASGRKFRLPSTSTVQRPAS
ncbi:hypothetical protein PJP07_00900 [Mycobacterium kansasii]